MIDTANENMVGIKGSQIVFVLPPTIMTKERALVLAAWIVTLADDEDKFSEYLKAVQS